MNVLHKTMCYKELVENIIPRQCTIDLVEACWVFLKDNQRGMNVCWATALHCLPYLSCLGQTNSLPGRLGGSDGDEEQLGTSIGTQAQHPIRIKIIVSNTYKKNNKHKTSHQI